MDLQMKLHYRVNTTLLSSAVVRSISMEPASAKVLSEPLHQNNDDVMALTMDDEEDCWDQATRRVVQYSSTFECLVDIHVVCHTTPFLGPS